MSEKPPESSGNAFLAGAIFGAGVGALLGLLYAPRSGAQMRHELAEKSESLRQRVDFGAGDGSGNADPQPSPGNPRGDSL